MGMEFYHSDSGTGEAEKKKSEFSHQEFVD